MRSEFEVVVVGGGILGCGIAQAVAAAGYSCLVVERSDWAAGTSSKSSKLIHGGLRYLETAQLGLVRESLRERAILLRIAPDLVKPLPFLVPVYADTRRKPWQLNAGLLLYALLSGWTRLANFGSYAPDDADHVLGDSGLRRDGLLRVFRYWDAQTDDALLTRAVVASARELGAEAWCPAELLTAERVTEGYDVRIRRDADETRLRCRFLINAAGPWSSVVRERVRPALPLQAVDCVLGSHLVIEPRLSERAFYLESPSDGRAVFALPWKGRTLLGTTEHVYRGDPDRAAPPLSDNDYLLGVLGHYFPHFDAQIVDRFAGLRVLPAGEGTAFRRPRECVLQRDPQHPRMISLSGGKLTGYRAIAERVAATLRAPLGARHAIADTAELRLPRLDESLQELPSASSNASVQRT